MTAIGVVGGDPSKVSKAGDTMTGPLVLPGDPASALQAADKSYVDTHGGGGGSGGFKGFWSNATTYNAGDIVTVGRSSYGALQTNLSKPPYVNAGFLGSPGGGASDGTLYELGNHFVISNANTVPVHITDIGVLLSGASQPSPLTAKIWHKVNTVWVQELTAVFQNVNEAALNKIAVSYDFLPGHEYIVSCNMRLYTSYTTNFYAGGPVSNGLLTATEGLFNAVAGSLPNQTSTTAYFIYPFFDQPDLTDWLILGRF